MSDKDFRTRFENFKVEIDPDRIDDAVRQLTERTRNLVEQGRHVKVRLKYKGQPLMPDVPLPVFAAAEVAGLWTLGLMSALVFNLGAKAFLEVEFIHEASERVAEGQKHYQEGEIEAAEASYREALRMKPGDTSALYHLGVVLRVIGRTGEARECFVKAAEDLVHADGVRARDALDRLDRPKSL